MGRNSYKRQFSEFVERANVKLFENLSDVMDADVQLKVGDRIMFTNDYGITFGYYEVLGFCEPDEYGHCIYFDHAAYWYPCRVNQVRKV